MCLTNPELIKDTQEKTGPYYKLVVVDPYDRYLAPFTGKLLAKNKWMKSERLEFKSNRWEQNKNSALRKIGFGCKPLDPDSIVGFSAFSSYTEKVKEMEIPSGDLKHSDYTAKVVKVYFRGKIYKGYTSIDSDRFKSIVGEEMFIPSDKEQ